MKPVRLQLSRKRGFQLQETSVATNGLPAVLVTRPGRWGNPFVEGTAGAPDASTAVERFRTLMVAKTLADRRLLDHLKGKNLACWCKLDEPCHADVLLEMANR